jgi:hypothetical protein
MNGEGNVLTVYAVYAVIAVALTALLARTLFRNGTAFLHDVFEDRPGLADAVNRLLVVGFYMLNLGYALYLLRATKALGAFDAVQFLVNRLALLLVSLAVIHFVNVAVFWKIRARREQRTLPHPVAPQVILPPPQPAAE